MSDNLSLASQRHLVRAIRNSLDWTMSLIDVNKNVPNGKGEGQFDHDGARNHVSWCKAWLGGDMSVRAADMQLQRDFSLKGEVINPATSEVEQVVVTRQGMFPRKSNE